MGPLIFIFVAFVGVVLGCWQWRSASKFLSSGKIPTQTGEAEFRFLPVTILKPVSGADKIAEDCIRSWLEQEYPRTVQWLFGVESRNDPAREMVDGFIREFPEQNIQLVVCDQERCENPKMSILIQLFEQARNERVIVSDADVKIRPGFLEQFVRRMNVESVGILCCLYRLLSGNSLPMKLERLHHNIDFWSQVLMSISLKPMDYALGAVMGFRKTTLDRCGGFEAVADVLADDYQLGRLVVEKGFHVELSDMVVDCETAFQSPQKVWSHQVRWSRTIRACRPVSYALSLVANITFWSVLAMVTATQIWTLLLAAIFILFRILLAKSLLLKFSRSDWDWKCWFLVPLKDLLHVIVLAAGYTGNRIRWKDRDYRLGRNGKLTRLQRSE